MKPLRRVLIVQPYGIGDLLFLTPVLRALRLIPSVEVVDLLLGSRTEAAVVSNPHVDKIFNVDKDLIHRQGSLKNIQGFIGLGGKLRKRKYDLLLDYSLRGEYAFVGQFFLGIPKRAGFDYKRRSFFHTHRVPIPGGFAGRHVAEYVCELAEEAGIPIEDRFLEFYVTEKDREEASGWISKVGFEQRKILILSPGGGESWGKDACFKRWPVRYLVEFLEKVRPYCYFDAVLILGSSKERDLAQEVSDLLRVENINGAGELSLGTVGALMERAVIFVGNDGGLVHLARALCLPLIAFYGPVDPQVYGPYPPSEKAVAVYKEELSCRPCYVKFRYNSSCIGRECLQDLKPEEALEFLKRRNFFGALEAVPLR